MENEKSDVGRSSSCVKSNIEYLQLELAKKQKEVEAIADQIWQMNIICPDGNSNFKSVQTAIRNEIMNEPESRIYIAKIQKIIAIDQPEILPHADVLRKFLDWYMQTSPLPLSEYLKWQPRFKEYGFQMRLEVHNGKCHECSFCKAVRYEGDIQVNFYQPLIFNLSTSVKRLNIRIDIDQPKMHSVALSFGKEIWKKRLEDTLHSAYNIPKSLSTRDLENYCFKISKELEFLLSIENSRVVRTIPPVSYACEKCIAHPDWSLIKLYSEFEWLKAEWIKIEIL